MPILGDYHTHTTYSHGSGSVAENVAAARKAGLKAIAITDHGFRHLLYNVKRSEFPDQLRDVEEARRLNPDMQILLGLETNIQGNNGRVDLKPQDLDKLDIIVCGYHRMVFSPTPASLFGFWMPNFVGALFGHESRHRRAKNTDAFIHALNRYPIDILSHPKYKIDIDVVAVAKEAARLGTYFELNGKKVSLTDQEIIQVLDTGVGIILDSDAHSPDRVGEISVPMSYVDRIGIPKDRIVNWDKLPVLRSAEAKKARRALQDESTK